jgi:hypothetical protein
MSAVKIAPALFPMQVLSPTQVRSFIVSAGLKEQQFRRL